MQDRKTFWKLHKHTPFTCSMCKNRATYMWITEDGPMSGVTPVCNVHRRIIIETVCVPEKQVEKK
jgi:hypothetical protein